MAGYLYRKTDVDLRPTDKYEIQEDDSKDSMGCPTSLFLLSHGTTQSKRRHSKPTGKRIKQKFSKARPMPKTPCGHLAKEALAAQAFKAAAVVVERLAVFHGLPSMPKLPAIFLSHHSHIPKPHNPKGAKQGASHGCYQSANANRFLKPCRIFSHNLSERPQQRERRAMANEDHDVSREGRRSWLWQKDIGKRKGKRW